MNIDVYTKNGEMVEVHWIVEHSDNITTYEGITYNIKTKNAAEIYILLDQAEPRTFYLNKNMQVEKITLNKSLFDSIMDEAQRKFKSIRLEAMLNPDDQFLPPLITFFENCITLERIEIIKEDLRKIFLKKKTHIGTILERVDHFYNFELELRFVMPQMENCIEIQLYIPCYDTFTYSNVHFKMDKVDELIGSIRIEYSNPDEIHLNEVVITKII
ncbi:TPA: hypothetical protein ACG05V_005420 [Bacillus pacificus]|uniref:hypothetical protein n=1 Tax=Bacillus TaxID=1386 RepID=UPI00027CCB97|nr:hypothetical protein BCK_27513 [Bacillus cereus FRI-35]